MSEQNDGGLAFPSDFMVKAFSESTSHSDDQREQLLQLVSGMTLRDYFAAKAMPIFSGVDVTAMDSARVEFDFANAAAQAYDYAAAMLTERAKRAKWIQS